MRQAAHATMLRAAALLVPRELRAEWLAEWSAELWVVRRVSGRAASFCLGAFRDALWVRQNNPAGEAGGALLKSPLRCLLVLAGLAAVTVGLVYWLPDSRAVLTGLRYRDASGLVMISRLGNFVTGPTISVGQYLLLAKHAGKSAGAAGRIARATAGPELAGVAFYRPVRAAGMTKAVASANLFDLLHGTESRRLPGKVEGWLLVDEQQMAAMPQDAKGYVVGRLGAKPRTGWRWRVSVPKEGGDQISFDCTLLVQGPSGLAHLVVIAIALLILPATTSLGMGEYPRGRYLRRWIFLGAKIALLLPMVFFAMLILAPSSVEGFLPQGLLVGYVVAFRWALQDQRRRCPVCLRRLTNPIRFGQPAHSFLDWYGTELICAEGHGTLQVPEIPSSCYSAPRWLCLQ